MIEYRTDPMHNLYRTFKKAETYLDILNTKFKIKKELKLKSGYEVFKSFQATVTPKQNPRLCFYKATPRKAWSYSQISLLYQDEQ